MDDSVTNEDSSKVFEKSEYVWIIHKFRNIVREHEKESFLDSQSFPETDRKYKWKMRLYPNGRTVNKCAIALYLCIEYDSCDEVFTQYSFQLKDSNDEILFEYEDNYTFDVKNSKWGDGFYFHQGKLLSKIYDDSDTIKIKVTILAEILKLQSYHVVNNREETNLSRKLSREFETMLIKGEFSDFIIKLDGEDEIPVHRAVLAARSPVFSAMFKHKTSENELGYTRITGIKKDAVFNLLKYIYTGDISNLTRYEAKKLLPVADKYEILDLKQCCANIIGEDLKVWDILDVLILADLHSVSSLKQAALDYIVGDPSKFCDFSTFDKIRNYPDLLIEVITKMTQKHSLNP